MNWRDTARCGGLAQSDQLSTQGERRDLRVTIAEPPVDVQGSHGDSDGRTSAVPSRGNSNTAGRPAWSVRATGLLCWLACCLSGATEVRGQQSAAAATPPSNAAAAPQQVRIVTHQGVTYREVYQVVQRPVMKTEWVTREVLVPTETFVTEMRDRYQAQPYPVVQYQWQPRWYGLHDAMTPREVGYEMIPVRKFGVQVKRERIPVSYRTVTQQKQLVQVPQVVPGFESTEVVVARVPLPAGVQPGDKIPPGGTVRPAPPAVGPPPEASGPAASVARGFGGVQRMDR